MRMPSPLFLQSSGERGCTMWVVARRCYHGPGKSTRQSLETNACQYSLTGGCMGVRRARGRERTLGARCARDSISQPRELPRLHCGEHVWTWITRTTNPTNVLGSGWWAAENERGLEARLKLCCGWRFGIRPRRPRREDLATRQVSALGDSPLCTVIVLQILVFS